MSRRKERGAAAPQLAIHHLMWPDGLREMGMEITPEEVEAEFFYVSTGRTLISDETLLLNRMELGRKMRELIG